MHYLQVTIDDLKAWEIKYARIPHGAVVQMYSGWTARWPGVSYLGTTSNDTEDLLLKFPGLEPAAAEFLVKNRTIHGFGVDTASVDYGPSREFKSHRILSAANIFILENVAMTSAIPRRGATIMTWPMKIRGASAAPCRVSVTWKDD